MLRAIVFLTTCIFALAQIGCLARSNGTSADISPVIGKCRKAVGIGTPEVIFARDKVAWHVSSLNDAAGRHDVTDSDLARLSTLTNLADLSIQKVRTGESIQKGLKRLSAITRLRSLSISGPTDGDDLRAISSLSTLEEIYIADTTHLAPEDFDCLQKLPNLKRLYLDVSGAESTQQSLAHVGFLKQLEELGLSITTSRGEEIYNDASLDQLRGLTRLRSLRIPHALIGPHGLALLKGLPQLERLAIFGVASPEEPGFRLLTNIVALSLGTSCGVPDSILDFDMPNYFRKGTPLPKHLQRVTIEVGEEDAKELEDFSSLPDLREFVLADGAVNATLNELVALRSLQTLAIYGNCSPVDDATLRAIARHPQLHSFTIWEHMGPGFTDIGMAELAHLPELRQLSLANLAQVTESGFAILGHLKYLRDLSLDLHSANSSDPALSCMASLDKLETLALHFNTLSDAQLLKLASLKNLRSLDITGCSGYTDQGLAALMQKLPQLNSVKITLAPQSSP